MLDFKGFLKQRSLASKILEASNTIHKKGRIGIADHIFLNEGKEEKAKYSYGCVMLDVTNGDSIDIIRKMQDEISDEDLYNDPENPNRFGKQDDVHITALYGLVSEQDDEDAATPEDVEKVIMQYEPFTVQISEISMFDNEKFDVVKIAVIPSEELIALHEELKEFPYKSDYDAYVPHITLAYCLKGTGEKYLKKFKDVITIEDIKDVTYSTADKQKFHYVLNA